MSQETKRQKTIKERLKFDYALDSKKMKPLLAAFVANLSIRTVYNETFVIRGLMKVAQTQKETLFSINVIFAELKVTFHSSNI
jgi:hypothetical protein